MFQEPKQMTNEEILSKGLVCLNCDHRFPHFRVKLGFIPVSISGIHAYTQGWVCPMCGSSELDYALEKEMLL